MLLERAQLRGPNGIGRAVADITLTAEGRALIPVCPRDVGLCQQKRVAARGDIATALRGITQTHVAGHAVRDGSCSVGT